jgi:hypothetical protein
VCPEEDELYMIGDGRGIAGASSLEILYVRAEGAAGE